MLKTLVSRAGLEPATTALKVRLQRLPSIRAQKTLYLKTIFLHPAAQIHLLLVLDTVLDAVAILSPVFSRFHRPTSAFT